MNKHYGHQDGIIWSLLRLLALIALWFLAVWIAVDYLAI